MANKDAARTKIAQGLESLRQGKGLDGEAIMAKLLEQIRHTPAEAAARILELRKGNILPEGETIKDLINHGRA